MATEPEELEDEDQGRTAFLARCVQKGDRTKFDELYTRTAPALYAWASLKARAGVDPGDVVGEVWLRALDRLHTHDGENHAFRAWIFGIAKNVLLQAMRSRRDGLVQAENGGSGATGRLAEEADSVTSVRERLARDDSIRRFVEYARSLDPVRHELLRLCGLEGLPCTEAAVRLGINAEAATKSWQRLRAELRERAWVRDLLLDEG